MLPSKRSTTEKDHLKFIYCIYGIPKSGKSTIVSQMGKVLFFPTEPGHKSLSIYKYKVIDEYKRHVDPHRWQHFLDCCRELVTEEHDFNCLAVDTVDNLWKWCSDYICRKHGIEHESDLGFGKGYSLIRDEFMRPINYLAQRGMGLIFVSHSKTIEKDLGNRKISYTDTTMGATTSRVVLGLCDYIFYFYIDVDGNRFIRTKGIETINAGDRTGLLSEVLPMDAGVLLKELKKEK